MRRASILGVLGLLLAPAVVLGQAGGTGRVTGVVTIQSTGQALPGANVMIEGTRIGVLTDANGRYVLTGVPAGARTVTATLIGYTKAASKVLVASGVAATANFHLEVEAVQLQGIVAVGYGTQSRRTVAGSVSSIRTKDITQMTTANPVDALKGRIPGVEITAPSNDPGGRMDIRIRGSRSMKASNDPLYVVDGVPLASGDLRDIDPSSIQSIDVLKDAAASAVYGSRGANGVILVTTKRGAVGTTQFDYHGSFGVQRIMNRIDMMNAQQYANFMREGYRTTNPAVCGNYMTDPTACDQIALDPIMRANLAAGVSTDWQDLITRKNAPMQDQTIGVSGGDDKTRFRASVRYLNQKAVTIQQGYQAKQGSLSVTHDAGRLNLALTLNANQTVRDVSKGSQMWDEAMRNSPLGSVRDSLGNLTMYPTMDGYRLNPVNEALSTTHTMLRNNLLASLNSTLRLLNGVNLHVNFGPQYSFDRDGLWAGPASRIGVAGPNASLGETYVRNYTLSNYLELDRRLGEDHRFQGTALYEMQGYRKEWSSTAARTLAYTGSLWYDLGTGTVSGGSSLTEAKLQSYMGRGTYTLKDRYALSVSARVDGSSVLAEGHKYAFFPAASASWQVGDEAFMKAVPVISDLKLRLSYGKVGNAAINPYATQGTLGKAWYLFGGTPKMGYVPNSIPNPNLEWEHTSKYNAGLDIGILNNRVSANLDAYLEKTSNLLLDRQLPWESGYSSITQNVGETQNKGFEAQISSRNLDNWHGLQWQTDLNFSMNRNKIVALQGGVTQDVGSGWWVGKPIRVIYDYKFLGIWQTADSAAAKAMGFRVGDTKVADLNGDGKIDGNDRTFLGNDRMFPNWSGSMNNRLTYRNLDLSVLATTRQGYMVYSNFNTSYGTPTARYNIRPVNYWTPENPSNEFPRPRPAGNDGYTGIIGLIPGSYVQIRDITLGYALPKSALGPAGVRSARLYARVQNPFLFKNKKAVAWDTEGGTYAGDASAANEQNSQYDSGSPPYRTLQMGVDVGF